MLPSFCECILFSVVEKRGLQRSCDLFTVAVQRLSGETRAQLTVTKFQSNTSTLRPEKASFSTAAPYLGSEELSYIDDLYLRVTGQQGTEGVHRTFLFPG